MTRGAGAKLRRGESAHDEERATALDGHVRCLHHSHATITARLTPVMLRLSTSGVDLHAVRPLAAVPIDGNALLILRLARGLRHAPTREAEARRIMARPKGLDDSVGRR